MEADLHRDPRRSNFVADVSERAELERNGLLTEHRHTRRSRKAEQRNVTRCARRDDERVDAILDQLFCPRRRGRAESGRDLGGASGVGVGDHERHAIEPAERLGVEGADPANADDPDPEWCGHRHGSPTVRTGGIRVTPALQTARPPRRRSHKCDIAGAGFDPATSGL